MRDRVLERFAMKEPTDLTFNDLFLLADGKERQLDKGVFVIITAIARGVLHIDCWMKAGIILSRHFHSDYYEFFNTKSGVLIDNMTKEEVNGTTFGLNEVHEPFSIEDWRGDIYCIKAKQ
jgi:hypothetical protein